jgi:hypothetical protein
VEPPNIDIKAGDEQIDCPDTNEFGSDSYEEVKSEMSGNITD